MKHDPSARRAQRHAHRHFARPRHTARKKHVRDIRARDQKHQRDNGHEDLERHRERATQVRDSAASWSELDTGVCNVIEVLLRGLRPEVAAHNLLEQQIGFGAGLGCGHAGFEPSDEIERLKEFVTEAVPTGTRERLLHRERNPQVGRLADRESVEARPGNANQRVVV